MAKPQQPPKLRVIPEPDELRREQVMRLEEEKEDLTRNRVVPITRLEPEVVPQETAPIKEVPIHDRRSEQPDLEDLFEDPGAHMPELEDRWGERGILGKPGRLVAIGVATALLIVTVLGLQQSGETKISKVQEDSISTLVQGRQEVAAAEDLVDSIYRVAEGFLHAESPEELGDFVRQPDRVMPLLRKFYTERQWVPRPDAEVRALKPITLARRGDFWVVQYFTSGQRGQLVVEARAGLETRVDWETFAGYQPVPWDKFVLAREPTRGLDFRVMVTPDTFYSHEYADSDEWICFRLEADGAEEPAYGYAQRDGSLAPELVALCRKGGGTARPILRLALEEGTKSRRGYVIEEIVAPRWLFVDPPALQ